MGPLAHHMIVHIILMNLLAPVLALVGLRFRDTTEVPAPYHLAVFSALQLLALWGWHAPPIMTGTMDSIALTLAMQASLFLSALAFWWAVLGYRGDQRWKPIVALLVTGKLFCLMAVLFVFAPRALYPEIIAGLAFMHSVDGSFLLADQQLAGSIMLVACPLTYVLAGVVLAARWLSDMTNTETSAKIAEVGSIGRV